MDFAYRLLGAVAFFNQRASRYRINLLPFNWIVIGILGFCLVAAVSSLPDALNNGLHPRRAALASIIEHASTEHNYVSVAGWICPGVGFTHTDTENGQTTTDAYYTLFVDPASSRAILVKTASDYSGKKPYPVTLSGLVEPMDSEVQSKLGTEGAKYGPIAADSDYVLIVGGKPTNASLLVVAAVAAALALLAMVATLLMRYTVFRAVRPANDRRFLLREEETPPQGAAGQAEPTIEGDVRVTGKFELVGVAAQRFLEVRCMPAYMQSGELAFASKIDASSRFFGVTTKKRAGVWTLAIQNRSVRDIADGFLYLGFGRRPAMRFTYLTPGGKGLTSAIVSCQTDADRALVKGFLTQPREQTAPA